MKSYVSVFTYIIVLESNFDIAAKRSRSAKGHYLNIHVSTRVPQATYQASRQLAYWL